MSFEGYYQNLCSNGHYWTEDVYGENYETCPRCGKETVWSNLVDVTNGSYEEGCEWDEEHRIDGFVTLEILSEEVCPCCGHVKELRYKIPERK